MCTVTFIARKHGYALGMNRDEKLTRAKGQSPRVGVRNGVKMLCPSESNGGTWITVNEFGATLSLINWYSVSDGVERGSVSRGEIIKILSASNSPNFVDAGLTTLPLRQINPFRLIGVFPALAMIVEWSWDFKRLVRKTHPWKTQQWISSGFDEPKAQVLRGRTFRRALRQSSASSIDWLRRLHRSHTPGVGPFSTCMHRTDAATVSYTEVTVSLNQARMLYHRGAPCRRSTSSVHFLGLGVVLRDSLDNRNSIYPFGRKSGRTKKKNFEENCSPNLEPIGTNTSSACSILSR